MEENFKVLDWELSEEDMGALSGLEMQNKNVPAAMFTKEGGPYVTESDVRTPPPPPPPACILQPHHHHHHHYRHAYSLSDKVCLAVAGSDIFPLQAFKLNLWPRLAC